MRSTDGSNVRALLQPSKLHVDHAWIAALGLSASTDRAITEHRKIVDAIEGRDVGGAAKSMRRNQQRIGTPMNELDHLQPALAEHD